MKITNIPARLLKYKEEHNITYEELGKLLGASKAVTYDIVKGERRFVKLEVIEKALRLLGD